MQIIKENAGELLSSPRPSATHVNSTPTSKSCRRHCLHVHVCVHTHTCRKKLMPLQFLYNTSTHSFTRDLAAPAVDHHRPLPLSLSFCHSLTLSLSIYMYICTYLTSAETKFSTACENLLVFNAGLYKPCGSEVSAPEGKHTRKILDPERLAGAFFLPGGLVRRRSRARVKSQG